MVDESGERLLVPRLVLSKSGGAVLLLDGGGRVWVTSSKFVGLLLERRLRGSVLFFKELSDAKGLSGGSVEGLPDFNDAGVLL